KLLDDKLREKLYEFFGKKILYSDVMDHSCQRKYEIVDLPLPGKIRETISKKDAECNVFATVVDKDEMKNDFFNCQIYHPRSKVPRLIIHCYQKNQKNQSRTLKIK